jgi:hypothetical protein
MPLLCITHSNNDDSMYHSDRTDVPFSRWVVGFNVTTPLFEDHNWDMGIWDHRSNSNSLAWIVYEGQTLVVVIP